MNSCKSDKYFASHYLNVYSSHRCSSILFNGFTGAIDEVSTDLGEILSRSAKEEKALTADVLNALSQHELEFLERRGHVTTLDAELEINKFAEHVERLHHQVVKNTQNEASLMLVPSYNCNLACSYCYQGMLRENGETKVSRIMTQDQVDLMFDRVLQQLFPQVSDMSRIGITLYGGEPFMLAHLPALKRLIIHTKKHQMKISSISNTTRIDDMLELFGNEIGLVNSIQVSFDGSKENHDRSRIGKNNEPTFEKIIENIHQLVNRRVRVGIRINIDKNSVATLPDLIERLQKENIMGNPLVRLYCWVIHSHYDQIESARLLTPIELSEMIKKRRLKIETPVGRRERRMKQIFDAVSGMPLRRTAFCMKCLPNSLVYDSYNDIYSCYEEAGHPEKRVGLVDDLGNVHMDSSYEEGLSRHVATIDECKRCSLALTCGGGCPFAAKQRKGTMFSADCDCHKECTEKAVQDLFKKKVESAGANSGAIDGEELFPYA